MRTRFKAVLAGAALVAAALPGALPTLGAEPMDLFISEYVDGAPGNNAIELYNGTGATIDLEAGGYGIHVYANGATSPTATIPLEGTVIHGDVFVVGNSAAVGDIFTQSDLRHTDLVFNGNDAVALVDLASGALIDLIGQIGVNPPTGWGSGEVSTNDRTLVRKATISAGRTTNDAFDPAAEWNAFAFDTTSHLGSHTFDPGPATDSGVVDASISMADSTICIELSTADVEFGEARFGQVGVEGSPNIQVTNCGPSAVTLYAHGTDATAPGASWNLVQNGATCQDDLGTDSYHLRLHEAQTPDVFWTLGATNQELEDIATDGLADLQPLIDTACPGSSGAGLEMEMQIVLTATDPS